MTQSRYLGIFLGRWKNAWTQMPTNRSVASQTPDSIARSLMSFSYPAVLVVVQTRPRPNRGRSLPCGGPSTKKIGFMGRIIAKAP